MLTESTSGLGKFVVGTIIICELYTWKVIGFGPNGRVHTEYKENFEPNSKFKRGISTHESGFLHYKIIQPYSELKYDATQQGDRDDDI